jgi:Xaa-Pro aminopeptidase
MKINQLRVSALQKKLSAEKLDAVLISKMENIRYLSSFSGSTGYMIVDQKNAYIFVDFRYVEQVKKETSKIEIIHTSRSQSGEVCEFIKKKKYKKIAVEGGHLSLNNFRAFEEQIAKSQKLIAASAFIENERMEKSKDEIALIKKAVDLSDHAFYQMISKGKENFINKSESEIAAKLEYYMKCGGAQSPSFESIVAFGTNSAYPHYKPSSGVIVKPKSKKAGDGSFLKIDFGAKLNGYCSDMTRTVLIGKPSQKHLDIYKIVLEAQLTAISMAKPGMSGMQIDKIARDVITKYGYKDNFGHGLGHGVGLEIHEGPTVSALGEVIVKENMVFTIEPGVYIPGFGGVRIEDIVVMEKKGCKILTKTTKEIIIIE